jgi:flagellar hook-associated protein 3 FlgL
MRPVHSAVHRALAQSNTGRAVPRARAELDRLGSQLATGLRIQRPSDDPTGYARARDLDRTSSRLAQVGRGIGAAQMWSDRTEAELGALSEVFAEAYDVGLRAANGVYDPEDLAREIDALRGEAVTRLNAQSAGEYLFAGNETTTAPLDDTGAVVPGDFSGRRTREVAPGVALAVNVPGTDALYVDGVAAPDRLQALADAIRGDDRDALTAALEGVGGGRDHYIELGGRTGTVARQLGDARDAAEAQRIAAEDDRAEIEEIDLAETLGSMQRQQTALEAALRATASQVQTTLLDYLR